MKKDELIKITEELHQETLDATSYFAIIQQLRSVRAKYADEMHLSPAFFSLTLAALQKACFMDIAKLYEQSRDAIGIGKLLQICKEHIHWFPKNREIAEFRDGDTVYRFEVPYQHHLKPKEECFFKDEVERQRAVQELFNLSTDTPICVDLTFEQFLELYMRRFHSLSKKLEYVRRQRNKLYAHNDEDSLLDTDQLLAQNPISYQDMEELIDFAQDVVCLIIGTLTGVYKARRISNIDDLENTLEMAKIGLKYQDYELEQKEEGWKKKMRDLLRSEPDDELQ